MSPSSPTPLLHTTRHRVAAALSVLAIVGTVVAAGPAQATPTEAEAVVRLVIDDPGVAAAADAVPGVTVPVTTDLFAAVDVPVSRVAQVQQLAASAGASIEVDREARLANVVPTDPFFSSADGLVQMDMGGAWLATEGASGTVIAIIDTGVATVPELTGRVLTGYSLIAGQPARVPASDGLDDQHGTMSATVAAGAMNNGVGSVGSCPRCTILPVRVFAQGADSTSFANIAAGIVWAADNGADVISMSLAGPVGTQALTDAVTYAHAKGVVLVAAAGNEGGTEDASTAQYPAALPEVLSVAGVTTAGQLYSWSSRGPSVDFAAHGCNVAQDDELNIAYFCGTSAATPLLAGALALYRTAQPAAGPIAVRTAAADVRTMVAGIAGGYVNAAALLGVPGVATTPTGAAGNPVGEVTSVRRNSAGVTARGWAYDPNTDRPVAVTVRSAGIGDSRASSGRADQLRLDGRSTGFTVTTAGMGNAPGACVDVANIGPGTLARVELACRSFALGAVGAVESVAATSGGTAAVTGWALDPDGDEVATVRVYRAGAPGITLASTTTTVPRLDVASTYPAGARTTYGYATTLSLGGGTHTLCAEASFLGLPHLAPVVLGCGTVTLAGVQVAGTASAITSPGPGVVAATGTVAITGSTAGASVALLVDGRQVAATTATGSYTLTGASIGGAHNVCVQATHVENAATVTLGCSTVTLPGGNPVGSLEAAYAKPGGITVSGWALDPDTVAATSVHVYVDGRYAGATTTTGQRTDVAASWPAYGTARGYTLSVNAAAGAHTVCVYAINTGVGTTNPSLGCRSVTVLSGNPIGSLEAAYAKPGGITVSGWALDPDTTAATSVHVYVDGRYAGATTTTGQRTDVARVYPGYGTARGYTLSVNAAAGAHTVCVYALNVGAGTTNPSLGCRSVMVLAGNPIGSLESVTRTGTGTVRASGWALDPDTTAATSLHVYVNGRYVAATTTNRQRNDIASLWPGYGVLRGFAIDVNASANAEVCVYAINAGPGTANPLLGCRRVP